MTMTRPRTIEPAARTRGIRYAVRDVIALAEDAARAGREMLYLNIGDPNLFDFEPDPANDTTMSAGDFVLIDLWAKMDRPRSVYSDLTRVGFIGKTVPQKYEEVFQIVAVPLDGGTPRVLMPWRRCLRADELDGLRDGSR